MIQTSLLSAFGGYAIINGISNATKKIADFEFQMAKVRAVSGASAEQVKQLEQNARDLGAVSQFTASEIGKLQEELARLGFGVDQIINMTDASRKLAQVSDAELGEAARTVGQVLNAFNLEATESNRIANVMAESFSKSSLNLEKFGVAMGNVGANAKAFGLSVEETTAMLGLLVDAGIDASKAGTDLRMILIESAKSGKTLEEAFEEVRNSENKLTKATDLFGTRAGAAGIILAENTSKLKALRGELSDTNAELDEMSRIMEDTLIGDWKKLNSALEALVLQGGAVSNVLRGIVQHLTEMANLLNSGQIAKFLFNNSIFGRTRAMLSGSHGATVDPSSIGPSQQSPAALSIPTKTSSSSSGGGALSSGSGINTNPFAATTESIGFASDMLFNESETLATAADQYIKTFDAFVEDYEGIVLDFDQIAVGGLASAFAGIGTAFADGENVAKAAFSGLLGGIGAGLQQMGGALIAYGVSLEAFKKAIANPAIAIAAGAAAITAGAAVMRYAQKIGGSSGGSSSVPSTSGGGGAVFGGSSSPGTFRGGQSTQFEPSRREDGTLDNTDIGTALDHIRGINNELLKFGESDFTTLNNGFDNLALSTSGVLANMQLLNSFNDSSFAPISEGFKGMTLGARSLNLELGAAISNLNALGGDFTAPKLTGGGTIPLSPPTSGGEIVGRISGNDIVLVANKASASNSRFQANRRGQLSITR